MIFPIDVRTGTTVQGIVYPNLESLADSLYTAAFSDDAVSGMEYEFGGSSEAISSLDSDWLRDHGEETDPRLRTHEYLSQLVLKMENTLRDKHTAYYDRHYLDQDFDTLPDGTPYSYTDISVSRHPKGVVLTQLGGGYATDGPLLQVANSLPKGGKAFAVHSTASALYSASERNSTLTLPVRRICQLATSAATHLGVGDRDLVAEKLHTLYVPSEGYIKHMRDTQYQWAYSHPATALGASYSAQEYGPYIVNAQLSPRYRSYSLASRTVSTTTSLNGGKIKIISFDTDPLHTVDTETGEVTYGIDPEASPDNAGLKIEIRLSKDPSELDESTNAQISAARAILAIL